MRVQTLDRWSSQVVVVGNRDRLAGDRRLLSQVAGGRAIDVWRVSGGRRGRGGGSVGGRMSCRRRSVAVRSRSSRSMARRRRGGSRMGSRRGRRASGASGASSTSMGSRGSRRCSTPILRRESVPTSSGGRGMQICGSLASLASLGIHAL